MIDFSKIGHFFTEINKNYIQNVNEDIEEAKNYYQYIEEILYPFNRPHLRCFKVIAVNNETIRNTYGRKSDYIGNYSKELYLIIPKNYKEDGCVIYGAPWLNINKIPYDNLHININRDNNNYHELCTGIKKSNIHMKNPILENIRTAEHIINEYSLISEGFINKIHLIEYSHNAKGIEEYEQNTKRYRTK